MQFQDFSEIQTNRLVLPLIQWNDVDIIYALRSNAEVQKYIQREPYKTKQEAEVQVKKVSNLLASQEAITWIITLKSETKKIGSICFWNFSKDKKIAEVGYDLLPEYHNKGIMNEALQSVLYFGFNTLQLKKVEAFTSKHNKGSVVLLEKNNFKLDANRVDEGFPDNLIFTLTL